jgi:fibronectin type 3 domain-containing protein
LSWSGNGSFYNVYRSTNSGGGYIKIASLIPSLTYPDSTVQNGTAYYYVVTALNILGEESAYSAEVFARPASTAPQAIGVSLVNISGQNGIQFSWAADHIGWRLTMNTNDLGNSAAWFTVPNSAVTNQMWLPLDPAQTSAFFRLIYP